MIARTPFIHTYICNKVLVAIIWCIRAISPNSINGKFYAVYDTYLRLHIYVSLLCSVRKITHVDANTLRS